MVRTAISLGSSVLLWGFAMTGGCVGALLWLGVSSSDEPAAPLRAEWEAAFRLWWQSLLLFLALGAVCIIPYRLPALRAAFLSGRRRVS